MSKSFVSKVTPEKKNFVNLNLIFILLLKLQTLILITFASSLIKTLIKPFYLNVLMALMF